MYSNVIYFENERHFEPGEDVLKRMWNALKYDVKRWKRRWKEARMDPYQRNNPIAHIKRHTMDLELFPFETQILIIGGGLMGSSVAYWLKQAFRDEDYKFAQSASMLTCGGISQQFSVPEHVTMSAFAAEYLRHAGEHLRILDNDPPDVHFLPMGFMYLARTPEEVNRLKKNWKVQMQNGARIDLMNRDQLRARFPFINFDDVLLGSYGLENEGTIDAWQLLSAIREKNLTLGLENEGTIDAWQLLSAIREKNLTLGVQYLKGEVEGFYFGQRHGTTEIHGTIDDADEAIWRNKCISGAFVRPEMTDASARIIRSSHIVVAAGAWSSRIAEMARIGKGRDLLAVKIPVVARKRMVFVVHAPDVPALDMPAIVDPSGVYCLMEEVGNTFICGKIPTKEEDEEIDHSNLEVDYDYFYDNIWPILAKRVPAFKNLKIKNAWAGYEDVNTFDNSPVIGEHLLYQNLHFLCGFGNRGMQHALAVGRSYAEKLLEGAYLSLNLRKFDMRRLVKMEKLEEEYG
uniref:FAD-dependent oxidoreductase domain-containing protein 1 n=1 Tax=Setaria digitata TaxID=48799 RepID=A0A915Q506_9BILA